MELSPGRGVVPDPRRLVPCPEVGGTRDGGVSPPRGRGSRTFARRGGHALQSDPRDSATHMRRDQIAQVRRELARTRVVRGPRRKQDARHGGGNHFGTGLPSVRGVHAVRRPVRAEARLCARFGAGDHITLGTSMPGQLDRRMPVLPCLVMTRLRGRRGRNGACPGQRQRRHPTSHPSLCASPVRTRIDSRTSLRALHRRVPSLRPPATDPSTVGREDRERVCPKVVPRVKFLFHKTRAAAARHRSGRATWVPGCACFRREPASLGGRRELAGTSWIQPCAMRCWRLTSIPAVAPQM